MTGGLAIALGGGGARAAYQVGVLSRLGREFPALRPAVLVGESAGAINAAYLAAHPGSLREAADGLVRLWSGLTSDRIFRVEAHWLARNAVRWGLRLASGGWRLAPDVRGLLDTAPLRSLLEATLGAADGSIPAIGRSLETGALRAIALTTIDYATGETVTWVQGCGIQDWQRPSRHSVKTRLTVDHVMASAALPLVFPAVELAGSWHGDGGMRLHAPLSPAVHLGARQILAISTRWRGARAEAPERGRSYPPLAQVGAVILNSVFLDLVDQDALNLERMNGLLRRVPPDGRQGLRPIGVTVIRPSQDLGRLAGACEACLPRGLRFMTRGLGTREASNSDLLSLLMFEPRYLRRLIEIGEADAASHMDEIAALIDESQTEPAADPIDPGDGGGRLTPAGAA